MTWGAQKGMPEGATGFVASGAKSTLASGAGAGAMAGLGVLEGYAAFVYAGYTSMSAMAEEYSSLRGQLRALTDKALPAAQAQVVARGREVTIAGYQRDLALADIALARDLFASTISRKRCKASRAPTCCRPTSRSSKRSASRAPRARFRRA